MALLLGLLTAVVWPLVLRIAMPIALFTFGLGSFLLLGALVLALSFAIPGVVVDDLPTGMLVVVVIASVSGLVSSLLAIDEDELFFRRARRKARAAADGEVRPPGRAVPADRRAALRHRAPRRPRRLDADARRLAAQRQHTLTTWHTDWSSQTGAAVSGILHGTNHDIFGFRWYDKERDRIVRVSRPDDAAAIERRTPPAPGCSPATAPAGATCSPATPRT